MRKFLILFFIILTQCGYQPIYLSQNSKIFEYSKIILEGNGDINRRLIKNLKIEENPRTTKSKIISIKSYYNIEETSKNQKAQVNSYRSSIRINLMIKNDNKIILDKQLVRSFDYNNQSSRMELINYQKKIKQNLFNQISEDIFLFLQI